MVGPEGKGKVIYDAILITLLGVMLGFSFNYARKDGVPIIKKPLPVKQSQSGEVRESRAVEPQEPEWIELELARKHFEEK
ncbi:MAG: hypothetical protein AB1756_06975, partial [Acidobacteriota bacterium]